MSVLRSVGPIGWALVAFVVLSFIAVACNV